MGMCKCKKRTELFCFVHKKAVCDQCICTDHQVCVVKSYVEWLTDPEYETPSCGICKGELVEGSMVRLLCLDMFHPECLDVYACSLPPNTAQAGYVCPTCNKPMLPSATNTSPIAQNIRDAFANSSWASPMLPSREDGSSSPNADTSNHNHNHSHNHNHTAESSLAPDASPSPTPASLSSQSITPLSGSKDTSNSYYTQASAPPSSTTVSINPSYDKQNASAAQSLYGVASRKPQPKLSTSYPVDEEDEDKYKRKGLMQLFLALGLLTKPTGSDTKKGLKLDPRRLLLIFALIASFATVIVLYLLVLDSGEELTTTEEDEFIKG